MKQNEKSQKRKQYLEYFKDQDDNKNQSKKSKQKRALKYALDIRKFEIQLYWQRATYFWAFIAASFAGYFLMISSEHKDLISILVVCILGFVFSYSWYFVNKGSKYWQNNWERHVDYLEDEITGPLYKLVKNYDDSNFLNPISEYPISVSKINQLLSLFITIVWVVLTVRSAHDIFTKWDISLIILLEIVFIAITTIIVYIFAKSHFTKSDKGNNGFIMRDLE